MKNIIIKSIIFLILISSSYSCQDFLTEIPTDRSTTSNFFQDMESLDKAVTSTYRELTYWSWARGLTGARCRTVFMGADDFTSQPGSNKGDFKVGDLLDITSSHTAISFAGWDMPYDVILQANFAIKGQRDLLEKGFEENEVNPKAAEAYFLRAWAYFRLVRLYGDLPIVVTPEYSPANTTVSRSPVRDVYDLILSDLEFAISNLPETQLERARINKWAALSLRSKVYLTMASWPLHEADKFALALTDAQDVIQNGPFAFENDFSGVFDIEYELTNTEFIWQITQCGDNTCPGGNLTSPFASQTTKPANLGGFDDLFIEKAYYNKFPEGARKEYTFLSQLISEDGTIIPWQSFTWKHPALSKFFSGTVDKYAPYETQIGATSAAENDFPMFRITELMLIYSEAQIMGGGGDAGLALEYLNMVRRRAKGVVDITQPDVDDLPSFTRQHVIDERGWEFVGEMKRWFDLTRTETLAEALADRDPSEMLLVGDPSNKNLYYHPLPALDLELNPNLTQNPR
ncbi:MAG: RagB/SusD family nutrient uptake outer membrane protein [Bacteroidota bacterium]